MTDATWKKKPGSGDYNTASNWSPAQVPSDGTATFGPSSVHSISISAITNVDGWTFAANAGTYKFTIQVGEVVDFNGAGILLKGASKANIDNENDLEFLNSSSAGKAHITNNSSLFFDNTATAGHATITNNQTLRFFNQSSADHAIIINNGSIQFGDDSSAGSATITTANGGTTGFTDDGDGGEAEFITQVGGTVDFSGTSGHNGNGVVDVGSIAGAGSYFLGDDELIITGNRSTTVSGLIEGGSHNNPVLDGDLVKQGTGTLILSHQDNSFLDTDIDAGTLDVAAKGAAGVADIEFRNSHTHETLKIENAALDDHNFQTVVDDFHATDVIDFAGLKFVKGARATLDNSGDLLVKSGKVTDSLQLDLAKFDHLKVVSDGHNGTEVIAMNAPMEKAVASADLGEGHLDFQHEVAHHDFIL